MVRLFARPRAWLVMFFVFLAGSVVTVADDMRTWTDKTGKHKIEAKFIAIENGKALLEKPDGNRLQIDLDKLSTEDRKLAEKLQKDKDQDNPFEKTAPGKKDMEKKPDPAKKRGSGEPELSEIDWAGVKQLSVFGSEWKAPAITPVEAKLSWTPRPVPLPPKADFFEGVTGIVASAKAKRAVLMTAVERPGNQEVLGRLFVCDLEKGRAGKQYTFAGKIAPLALSNDGTLLVVRHEVFGFDNSDKAELWRLTDNGVERLKQWYPTERPGDRGRDVIWAAFSSDDKTLMTLVSSGTLTWWDASDVKATQTLPFGGHIVSTPALSGDGKYLAYATHQDLILLDAESGATVAVKPLTQPMHQPRFSYSPDGKRLACNHMNKLDIVNLAEGTVETSVAVNGGGGMAPCFWTSPTAVLAGAPLSYVETSMNLNVWGYDGTEKVAALGDHGVMFVHDGGRNMQGLIALKLPHPAALQLIEAAKKDPNFFLVKPGTRITVDVSQIAEASVQQEAKTALETKLKENGNPVGPGGVILVASLQRGKDHEVSYRTFGTPPFAKGTTYHVTGWEYQLKLVAGDRTHWQTGAGNHPPPIIHLKRGESVEEHLKQYNHPSGAFFKFVELPKYVARAQGNDAAGSTSLRRSQVTAGGLR